MFRTLLLATIVTGGFMFASTSSADAGGRRYYRPQVAYYGYYSRPARVSTYYRSSYYRGYASPYYYGPRYYYQPRPYGYYGYPGYGYGYGYGYRPGVSIRVGF